MIVDFLWEILLLIVRCPIQMLSVRCLWAVMLIAYSHTLINIFHTRHMSIVNVKKKIQDQPAPLCHAQCSSPTHNVSLTYSWPNNYIHSIQKTLFNKFDKELPRAKLASAVRFAWFKFSYTNFSFLRFGHPLLDWLPFGLKTWNFHDIFYVDSAVWLYREPLALGVGSGKRLEYKIWKACPTTSPLLGLQAGNKNSLLWGSVNWSSLFKLKLCGAIVSKCQELC